MAPNVGSTQTPTGAFGPTQGNPLQPPEGWWQVQHPGLKNDPFTTPETIAQELRTIDTYRTDKGLRFADTPYGQAYQKILNDRLNAMQQGVPIPGMPNQAQATGTDGRPGPSTPIDIASPGANPPEGPQTDDFVKNQWQVAMDPRAIGLLHLSPFDKLKPLTTTAKPPPNGPLKQSNPALELQSDVNHLFHSGKVSAAPARKGKAPAPTAAAADAGSVGTLSTDAAVEIMKHGLAQAIGKSTPADTRKKIAAATSELEAKMRQYPNVASMPASLRAIVYGIGYVGDKKTYSYGAPYKSDTIEPFTGGQYKCNLFTSECYGKGAGIHYFAPGVKNFSGNGFPLNPDRSSFSAIMANTWADKRDSRGQNNFRLLGPGDQPDTGDIVAFYNQRPGHSGHVGLNLGHGLVLSAQKSGVGINTVNDNLPGHIGPLFHRYAPGYRR